MKVIYALAAVASLAGALPATAATIQVLGTVQDGDLYTNVAPDSAFEVDVSAYIGVMGTVLGEYKDVYEGTTLAGTTPYNAVTSEGTMTYLLSAMPNTFRMIWGTVDALNKLTLNLVGGGTEVVTGTDVLANPDVPITAGTTNVIVQIASKFDIKSVVITSGVNSFEHSFNPPEIPPAPVPVPAAGLLLVAALGGLGIASRRRKSA